MSKLPLVEGVLKYIDENNIPFSMPGHKAGLGFLKDEYGRKLYDNFIKGDITEVEGLDNLHKPEGIIKEAMDLLKNFYGSKKSYFLVNGSTSGNLAMIFSTFNEGDKVIVERNCHRSIFNGIIMRKLRPIYIQNEINSTYNAPLSIDKEHFLQLIREHRDAKGIIITYPNYYGVCTDLEFIIKEAKKYGMKVLVDSAHGAHFGVHKDLPQNAVKLGADMVVMSAHKTLPSVTQTAYLHIGQAIDEERVEFYISSLLSTSPSYMFLCSMDYARYYLEYYGTDEYEKLLQLAYKYRKRINELQHIHIIGKEDLVGLSLDESRYVINLERGYSGHKLLDYLRSKGIQSEMSDDSNVVLIFSPANTENHFESLYNALKDCNFEDLRGDYTSIIKHRILECKLQPYEVVDRKKSKAKLEDSIGKICGKSVVPYPPGVPLIISGESIDETAVDMIRYYMNNKVDILGLDEENIWIVEEQ